LNRYVKLIPT